MPYWLALNKMQKGKQANCLCCPDALWCKVPALQRLSWFCDSALEGMPRGRAGAYGTLGEKSLCGLTDFFLFFFFFKNGDNIPLALWFYKACLARTPWQRLEFWVVWGNGEGRRLPRQCIARGRLQEVGTASCPHFRAKEAQSCFQ